MSAFDQLRKAVSQALTRYEVVLGPGDPDDCLCHRCVFVRGVRGELAAFAKAEAKAEKKRVKIKLEAVVIVAPPGVVEPRVEEFNRELARLRKKRAK